jgi:hypothetical protein
LDIGREAGASAWDLEVAHCPLGVYRSESEKTEYVSACFIMKPCTVGSAYLSDYSGGDLREISCIHQLAVNIPTVRKKM